jgi:hypothetical protein
MTTTTFGASVTTMTNRTVPTGRSDVPSEVQVNRMTASTFMTEEDDMSTESSSASDIIPTRLEQQFARAAAAAAAENNVTMGNYITLPRYNGESDDKMPHRVWQSVKQRLHLINVYIGIDTDEDETYSYLFDDQEHMENDFYVGGYFDAHDDDGSVYTASTAASSMDDSDDGSTSQQSLHVRNIGRI